MLRSHVSDDCTDFWRCGLVDEQFVVGAISEPRQDQRIRKSETGFENVRRGKVLADVIQFCLKPAEQISTCLRGVKSG